MSRLWPLWLLAVALAIALGLLIGTVYIGPQFREEVARRRNDTTAPTAIGSVQTLDHFYTLSDQRKFTEAYDLMGSNIKGTASFSEFTSWFDNKLWFREVTPQMVSKQGTEAVVEATGWTGDRVTDGIRTWKFRERWKLVIEKDAWRLDTRLETVQIDEGTAPPFPTPTLCLSDKYPQKDEPGNLYEVRKWCDGAFTSRLVALAPTATPSPTTTPQPTLTPTVAATATPTRMAVPTPTFTLVPTATSPTAVIHVFFSIRNGRPWGYVIDRRGMVLYPSDGPNRSSIFGADIAPGDRIVLETDVSQFSLLFDCGPPSSRKDVPCDFTADSVSNLPREIRATEGGGGFLTSRCRTIGMGTGQTTTPRDTRPSRYW